MPVRLVTGTILLQGYVAATRGPVATLPAMRPPWASRPIEPIVRSQGFCLSARKPLRARGAGWRHADMARALQLALCGRVPQLRDAAMFRHRASSTRHRQWLCGRLGRLHRSRLDPVSSRFARCSFTFDVADIGSRLPEADASVDYRGLSCSLLGHHALFALRCDLCERLHAFTLGHFIVTVRPIGSAPTIFVNSIDRRSFQSRSQAE